MAEATIDQLKIKINADAKSASSGINSLVKSLNNLKSAVSGDSTKGLSSIESSIARLNSSLSRLNTANISKLGSVKVSATVGKNIERIGTSLASIPQSSVSRLHSLSIALNSFSSSASGIRSTANALKTLPATLREFSKLDMGRLTTQMKQLNTHLAPLANNVARLSAAYAAMPRSMRSAAAAARTVTSANRSLASTTNSAASSALNFKVNVGLLLLAFNKIKNALADMITNVNSFIENMNLFQVSMGKFEDSATAAAQKAQDVMGIDMGDWARNQGVFQTLATGMGTASDKAAVMSEQLTQLGYDISSFYNLPVEDAMLKIQSGLAGELEPLRRIGWDLSNAKMQQEAYALGISKSVQQMTQAEKVMLRYHMIMTQVTQVHGDMARTIESPANQLRILQAQIRITTRTIGYLFIPMLNAALPFVIGLAKAVRILANEIAGLMNIDTSAWPDFGDALEMATIDIASEDVDVSGLDDVTDSANDATEAVKELKNATIGMDKLNIISPNDSVSGNKAGVDGGGGMAAIDIPLDKYDFYAQMMSDINEKSDQIAKNLADGFKKILPIVLAIGAALAAWKLAKLLTEAGGISKAMSGILTKLRYASGILLAILGAAQLIHGTIRAWNEGASLDTFIEQLTGTLALMAGLALLFGPIGAGIGALIGGFTMLATALHDIHENGASLPNLATKFVGFGAAVGGSMLTAYKFFEKFPKAGEKVASTLTKIFPKFAESIAKSGVAKALAKVVGKVVGWPLAILDAVMSSINIIEHGFSPENFADVELSFGMLGAMIGSAICPGLGTAIGAVIGLVAGLIVTLIADFDGFTAWLGGIWDRIVEWWGEVWTTITNLLTMAWQGISDIVGPIFNGIVQALAWVWVFVQAVWQTAWDVITQILDTVWNFISTLATTIWTPIIDFFRSIWEAVSSVITTIWDSISSFLIGIWGNICATMAPIWESIQSVITTVWDAVSNVTTSIWNTISPYLTGIWDTISSVATSVFDAISSTVTSIWENIASVTSSIWDSITNFLSNAWNNIVSIGTNAFDALKNGISDIFNGIWDAVKGFISDILEAFKNLIIQIPKPKLPHIKFHMSSINGPFGAISIPSFDGIEWYAQGGFPKTGQLFMAREGGAEMVGGMGSRTAVANNEQIVTGIEQGVERGVRAAMGSGNDATLEQILGVLMSIAANGGNNSMSDMDIAAASSRWAFVSGGR